MRKGIVLDTGERKKSLDVKLDLIYQWCSQCVQNCGKRKGKCSRSCVDSTFQSEAAREALLLCLLTGLLDKTSDKEKVWLVREAEKSLFFCGVRWVTW